MQVMKSVSHGLHKLSIQHKGLSNVKLVRKFERGLHCHAGNLEPPDVRKLARLAQIHVTDDEVKEWEPKLKEIVGWLGQLQEIDVDGVDPTPRITFDTPTAAGKDIPVEFKDKEALMNAVPETEGPYVKVPKIM